MRVLVTGSAGHLGEALVRTLAQSSHEVVGLDARPSPFTTHVGAIEDADFARACTRGIDAVIHAAALHKPHVATHSRRAFVETNVAGTLNVLEAALQSGVAAVVFSSTTSVFGSALVPAAGKPAVRVNEDLEPVPKNIYGVTKKAAEDLCELIYRSKGLPCVVLRTARFFPEADDSPELRNEYDDLNLKVNEYLYRRLDLADAARAHVLAAERAREIGFGRYVLSAPTPFGGEHLTRLRTDAPEVVRGLFPDHEPVYRSRGWKIPPGIDRVYVSERARDELGWQPRFDFRRALDCLRRNEDVFSPLARAVGAKGYHAQTFDDGPYPVEPIPDPEA